MRHQKNCVSGNQSYSSFFWTCSEISKIIYNHFHSLIWRYFFYTFTVFMAHLSIIGDETMNLTVALF